MKSGPFHPMVSIPAGALFVLAIGFPTLVLLLRVVVEGVSPGIGSVFTERSLQLLGRTLFLATSASILAHLFAIPAAAVLGRRSTPWLAAAMTAILVCPPMVHAFGWRRLLPVAIDPAASCVFVRALWSWPIAAALLGTALRGMPRTLWDAARMDAAPWAAFFHVILPSLRRTVTLSFLVILVLSFSDYSVPHSFGMIVFPTELLGWAASAATPGDAVLPAILPLVLVGVGCVLILRLGKNALEPVENIDTPPTDETPLSWKLPATIVAAASLVVPLVALAGNISSISAFGIAWQTYRMDLLWTTLASIAAGVAAAAMGWGFGVKSPVGRSVTAWSLALGVAPGALTGLALVSAYGPPVFAPLYDHWPIVSLSYAAHFGWVGILAGIVARRRVSRELLEQAAVDGASGNSMFRHVILPLTRPTMIVGIGLVAALSLGDVAASSLVRVPGFAPIAHVIIEKFHRLEDDMLISLSLMLALLGITGVVLVAVAGAFLRRAGYER